MNPYLGSPLDRVLSVTPEGPVRVLDGHGFAVAMVESLPRCAAETRGQRVRVRGTASTADVEWVCHKNAAGDYAWAAIATLADPDADRITFWDDSTGAFGHLTAGTGLSISGTTLTATVGTQMVSAPAAANSTGTAGQIAYDSDYFYVCTATNTWKRVAIATWP